MNVSPSSNTAGAKLLIAFVLLVMAFILYQYRSVLIPQPRNNPLPDPTPTNYESDYEPNEEELPILGR